MTDYPSLYDITGDIKDLNTLLVVRTALREALAKPAVPELVPVAFRRRTTFHPNGKPSHVSPVIGSRDGWRYRDYSEEGYEDAIERAEVFVGDMAVRVETTVELLFAAAPKPKEQT